MSDRTAHAICEDGREIVRYDRAGKWYIEPREGERRLVTLAEAVDVAAEAHVGRGQIFYGRPGGGLFDKRARAKVDALYATRRSA